MSRFGVYSIAGKKGPGYVLDVQSDLLEGIGTRVVVPLLPLDGGPPPSRSLNPVFDVAGRPYLMLTQAIGAVSLNALRRPVTSLDAHGDDITRALDVLLTGF